MAGGQGDQLGQDALTASARLVGEQVGIVVRETLAGMNRVELAEATAGGEASVQVVVTLDRPS